MITVMLLLLIILLSCAKRSTAWKDQEVLTLLRQVPVTGNPSDMDMDNKYLYVTLDQGAWARINLNTYTPEWIQSLTAEDNSVVSFLETRRIGVVPEHNELFVNEIAGTDDVKIIRITDTDSLIPHGAITGATQNIRDMKVQAIPNPSNQFTIEVLYTISDVLNWGVYDGEAGMWFGIVKSITTPVTGLGVDMDAQHFYVAAQQRGILIYNRESSALVGQLAFVGEAQKVRVVNGYAYVAARQGGLHIIDVRNPAAPILVSSFDTDGYATSIDVRNNMAVVSSGSGGVYLFDVSNPSTPELIQNLTANGYTNLAKFMGNDKLVVGSRDQGINFYRIDR